MSLDQIITVQIDRNTTTPSAAGFGTPLVAGYFPASVFPQRTVSVSSTAEMVETYGFKTSDPVYLAASSCFAQNPSPPIVKIGRRALPPQQEIHITPDAPVLDEVHVFTVVGYDAAATFAARSLKTDTYTATITGAFADEEDIVDTVVALMPVTGDYALSKSGTGANAKLVITATNTDTPGDGSMDGLVFGVTYTVNGDLRGLDDLTPDPGIATDLVAIDLYDPDWYGLCIDSNSALEIVAAAAWVEAAKKQFACQTADIEVASTTDASDTTSLGALLKAANYERTMLFYHRNNREYIGAAMLGRALPEDAGSITWAYKELSGVSAQNLNTTEQSNLGGNITSPGGKNVNFLTTIAGVAVTRYGTSSGGEFMDVMRGTDWLAARIQERTYTLLIQNDKLPYTDSGIQAVRGEILAQLQQGVGRNFLAAEPEPTCTVPRAQEVSQADKGNRVLNDVTFRATLAGAIHYVAIEGELNL